MGRSRSAGGVRIEDVQLHDVGDKFVSLNVPFVSLVLRLH